MEKPTLGKEPKESEQHRQENDSAEELAEEFRKINANLRSRRMGAGLRVKPLKLEETPQQKAETSDKVKAGPSFEFQRFSLLDNKSVIKHTGVKGERIPALMNYVRLNIIEDKPLFEHCVEFEPKLESLNVKLQILNSLSSILGSQLIFDGFKLFLPIQISQKDSDLELKSLHPSNPSKEVKSTIKFIKELAMRDAVHFYNILFHRIMTILGMIEINRSHFDYRITFDIPEHKLEIWPGFVTAVDDFEGGLMLCCDASYRVLRTATLLEMLNNMKNSIRNEKELKDRFLNYSRGKIVLTRYNSRNHRVDEVAWDLTPNSTFNFKGSEVSYYDYYLTRYNIEILDLQQPLLIHYQQRKRNRLPSLTPKKTIVCLIPELCHVTGLSEDITSDYKVMRDIGVHTRLHPQKRYISLLKFLKNIKGNSEIGELLASWGLQIEDTPLEVLGRIIRAPNICLNQYRELKPAPNNFSREISQSHCFEPVKILNWMILCTKADLNKAGKLVDMYKTIAPQLGIEILVSPLIVNVGGKGTPEEFRSTAAQYFNDNIQVIIVVLPLLREDVYETMKKFCFVEHAIPCQMVLSQTLTNDRKLRAVMRKIVLQINCKLGGAIWTLKIPLPEKIMFIGMDVYHDIREKNPSCLGFVASLNSIHTRYFSRVIFQKPRQETMDSLKTIFSDALAAFKNENNAWPDRIVVFRDGVADGQFEVTLKHEVSQMTSVLDYVCEMKVKFSFTVVQKRINTRIFRQLNDSETLENPVPGTVIDHTATRKYLYDFFLVSQLVREGTLTPTHYVVLYDNASIQPDLIQKFAYASSFMYFNWAGSLRVPAMCQYAHKLAFLTGQSLHAEPSNALSKHLFYL